MLKAKEKIRKFFKLRKIKEKDGKIYVDNATRWTEFHDDHIEIWNGYGTLKVKIKDKVKKNDEEIEGKNSQGNKVTVYGFSGDRTWRDFSTNRPKLV